MDNPNSVRVPVTHDCGYQFEVPIAGKGLETLEFTCTECGGVDRFTPDQIAQIVAQYEAAKTALNQRLASFARENKGFTYRPN